MRNLILLIILIFSLPLISDTELRVKEVVFNGNQQFTDEILKTVVKVKKKDAFNARALKIDQVLLTNFYVLNGYRDVYVASDYEKRGKNITVAYDIREGKRFYLKNITISGNEKFAYNHLRREIKIPFGSPFNPALVEAGLNQIERFYQDAGKPYVLVKPRETIEEDSLITLDIEIEEGKTVYIRQIYYEGRTLVKAFLIRRELAIKKGDTFSQSLIETSQKNIYSTGLFKFVDYQVNPIGDDETQVALVWKVVEKKALWVGLRFGVGYEDRTTSGNVTTFDFTAETGHRNIAGTARSIALRGVQSLYFGSTQSDDTHKARYPKTEFSFTYVEPWVLNTRTPGIIRVAYSQESEPVATVPISLFSVSGDLSHQYDRYWSYAGGLSFEQVDIDTDDSDIFAQSTGTLNQFSQGNDKIIALRFDPVKDKRDNVLITQRGYLSEFRNKIAYTQSQPVIDGTISDTTVTNYFYKVILQWSRYQGFRWNNRWTLATRLRGGAIFDFLSGKEIWEIPTKERFFLGGASTIRGYGEQMIGEVVAYQTDDDRIINLPVGGRYVLLGNLELRVPLFWLFYGTAFTDVGNIWQNTEEIKAFSLKASSGAGLAVITPFGPIRFDYGLKWFPENDESAGDFHIGISFAF